MQPDEGENQIKFLRRLLRAMVMDMDGIAEEAERASRRARSRLESFEEAYPTEDK